MSQTKSILMDTAETLFAAHGYDATSLRAITQAADVNLAAVNYHFGGKQGLLEAVYQRRITPMNEERIDLLNALEKNHLPQPVPLTQLVESFIKPALIMSRDPTGKHFVTLLGRSYMEPDPVLQDRVRQMFEEISGRFGAAFTKTLPHLSSDELYCRMHFMVGVLAYCMSGADLMKMIASSRFFEDDSSETLIHNLVDFICNGMAAPESNKEALNEESTIESNVVALPS